MFDANWKSWFSFLAPKRKPRARFQPGLELLEDRWVPSGTGSISGFALQDMTGNGFAVSNQAQSGVAIKLYQDSNHDGVLDYGDSLVASQTTKPDGSYAFTRLGAHTFFVTESVPSGYVLTAPVAGPTATVSLAAGQAVSAVDFANFQLPNNSLVNNISFTVFNPHTGATQTVTNLRGNTAQGDVVTANFTVAAGATATVSLITYDAPGATFDANTASQQTIVDLASGTFTAGTYSLTVHLPDNYYQVDFVDGAAITQLGPNGSNIFYSKQSRLFSADNEGTQAFVPASLSGNVYNDVNKTGVYNSTNDVVLAGVTVTLTGTNDLGKTVSVSVMTDSNGNYSFTGLREGAYTITDTPSAGYTDELSHSAGSLGGNLATAGQVSNIVVLNGSMGINYDLPEVPVVVNTTVSISGTVSEIPPSSSSYQVILTDTTTNVSQTITLTGSGSYSFTGLTAGDNYTVTVAPPQGFAVSTQPIITSFTNLQSNVTGENFGLLLSGG